MWLGYPGTSGASYMDYIITDSTTSPLQHAEHYSEKLAYMPHTFFIGDHWQMFPHMVERAIIPAVTSNTNVELKDNVSIINATDLKPLVSIAENVKVLSLSHPCPFLLRVSEWRPGLQSIQPTLMCCGNERARNELEPF